MPTPIPPPEILNTAIFENGALLIDKPLEWTSFDVCAKLRNTITRSLDRRLKVGHAGTLDPMATGLLIVCTGKGTKAIDTFVAMNKRYSGAMRLGEGTSTYDAEGEVSERLPWEHITDESIQEVVAAFHGDLQQVPPMYSAIKVKGQKLYHLARDGQVIERESRPITISHFHVERDLEDPQTLRFVVDCSKGTYVRSLAYDVGRALGTVAHLTALRRETIGQYNVKDAWEFQTLLQELQRIKGEQQDEVQKFREQQKEELKGFKAEQQDEMQQFKHKQQEQLKQFNAKQLEQLKQFEAEQQEQFFVQADQKDVKKIQADQQEEMS